VVSKKKAREKNLGAKVGKSRRLGHWKIGKVTEKYFAGRKDNTSFFEGGIQQRAKKEKGIAKGRKKQPFGGRQVKGGVTRPGEKKPSGQKQQRRNKKRGMSESQKPGGFLQNKKRKRQ